jgi:hypothetical protein
MIQVGNGQIILGKNTYLYGFTSANVKSSRTMHIYDQRNGHSLCGLDAPNGWVTMDARNRTARPTTVCTKCDNYLARMRAEEAMLRGVFRHPVPDDVEPW